MNVQKHFDRFAKRIEKDMLPDICQIAYVDESAVTYANGIRQVPVDSFRTYEGSQDIPCRIDESRAFRPAEVRQQATEIFEYFLQLPKSVIVGGADRIIIEGERYVIRKLQNVAQWDATKQALIHRVTQDVVN